MVDDFVAAAIRMGIPQTLIVSYKARSSSVSIKGILGEGWSVGIGADRRFALTTVGDLYVAYFNDYNVAQAPFGSYSIGTRLKYNSDKKTYLWVASGADPVRLETMTEYDHWSLEQSMMNYLHRPFGEPLFAPGNVRRQTRIQEPPAILSAAGRRRRGIRMSDYCDCGSQANARCRCGRTVCSLHTQHPQPYHSNALVIAARVHEGRPEHALFVALNNAWSTVPNIMCGSCYGRAIDEVATKYVPVFQDHTDARAETIAAVLLRNESWTTGREFQATETIGQKTLRAAGHRVPWSHPDPLDTAARLYASSHGEPPETPIRMKQYAERKKMFGGTERVESLVTWGSIRAWTVSAKFTDDGYPESATVLIGATGTRKESTNRSPVDGTYFYNAQHAAEAKNILEGAFQALPTPGFYFTKEQAIAGALTSSF